MKRGSDDFSASAVADVELQADVMRFVAILALCLVAISTLVEGQRSAPVPEAPSAVSIRPPSKTGTSASPAAAPEKLSAIGGADRSSPSVPAAVPRSHPAPSGEVRDEPPTGSQPPPADSPEEKGLSLRFATDAALLRMAARGDARVFVLAGVRTVTLDLSDGIEFKAANPPPSYYSMSAGTVPVLLRKAFHGPDDAIWGVTLPDRTAAEIDRHLQQGSSGLLVIDSAGRVSLESTND